MSDSDGIKGARYSIVERRMWNDGWFRGLTQIPPCGAGLWIYLLTTPELGPLPGLIVEGEAAMAEHLGWPLEAFRNAFREASSKGTVEANWKARVLVIWNAVDRHRPTSPNVVKSWRQQWLEVPDCQLKVAYFHRLKAFVEGLGKGFAGAFRKAINDPSPNQDQDQDQDQDPPIPPERSEQRERGNALRSANPDSEPPEAERAATDDEHPIAATESPYKLVIRVWSELWQVRHGKRFVWSPTPGDGQHRKAQQLGHMATEAAGPDAERWLRHKIGCYLADNGDRGLDLDARQHPFPLFVARVNEYPDPGAKHHASRSTDELDDSQLPTARPASPEQVARAQRALAEILAPHPVRTRPRPELREASK